MKLEHLLLFCLVLFLIAGCATFKETLGGIRDDPTAFKNEAIVIAEGTKMVFPGLPYAAVLGIGYALSFARRMYKDYKKKEAQVKTT